MTPDPGVSQVWVGSSEPLLGHLRRSILGPEPANLLNMAIRRRRETNEIARGQTCAPVVLSTKAAGAVLPASSSP